MIHTISLFPEIEPQLLDFFGRVNVPEVTQYFTPHPFTAEQANYLCHRQGKDQYFVTIFEDRIIAYGILAGWEAGLPNPELNICVDPIFQEKRIGEALAHHLIAIAGLLGAEAVTMTIHPENERAVKLCKSLGVTVAPGDDGEELKGSLKL